MSMLRAYHYTDEEVGVAFPGPDEDRRQYCQRDGIPWPRFVWYEWPGFEATQDPTAADVFVVRQRFSRMTDEQIRSLPYLHGNEERHVFFDLSDHETRTFPDVPGVFFRSCSTPEIRAANPNAVLWPWAPIEKVIREYVHLPPGGFQYDVVFQSRAAESVRTMMQSIQEETSLKTHFKVVEEFFPHIRRKDPARGMELEKEYLETMQGARLLLCPPTIPEASRMRMWEAMAMGRISVLFNDVLLLPLEDKVDWDTCLLRLPLSAMAEAHKALPAWLAEHDDADIMERGQYARTCWQTWFAPALWGQTIGMIVRGKLGLG